MDHASRHGTALSIAFIDLDHFKRVNDRYSHAAGDRALESVAALMRAVVVKPALAARMGGEEFVLLLPGMTSSGACSSLVNWPSGLRRATWVVSRSR